ncbi:hypothetical protein Cni_G15147 [Canna indica]|uniref:Transcription factor CBF/NF-Y/archaeal histone domain-containing protein n=1 Tax=Canna indica TaxID=4628 RepID=A0AAQ3KGA3_9LILI|nr:hypothetical protein Cni_G15147 [Canna indica]
MASGAGFLGNQDISVSNCSLEVAGVAGDGNATAPPPDNVQPAVVREQDRFMPIANVIRIMRRVLPAHAKIADDAKEMIQECVSEYISFITSEANERCQREQRKTVTAEDVLWAMNKLGFDDNIAPLTLFLHRYRELEGDHRGSIRGEPLQLIKHRSAPAAVPDISAGGGASQYFGPAPLPPASLVMPPVNAVPQHHQGYFNDYIIGMYGSNAEGANGGTGSSSSFHVTGIPNFDHSYPPYK